MMWGVYSDLSYGGSGKRSPRTFVVGAVLDRPDKWDSIQSSWQAVNDQFGVPRFHAAHLNGRTYEYEGWSPERALQYSKKLLNVLNAHGPMMMFCSGIHADEYEEILSQSARAKLGDPYQLCFNSCIANVAELMDVCDYQIEDKFSVLVDRDDGYKQVIESFQQMKENGTFGHRARLGTCARGCMDEVPALQVSDLVAYEWFKWFNTRGRKEGEIRKILVPIVKRHLVIERYWDRKNLLLLRDRIERTPAENGQLIIVPPI